MAIVETKVDELMALVDRSRVITTKAAGLELQLPEEYIRRLALAMQKNKLIDLTASAFKLTMVSRTNKPNPAMIEQSSSAEGSS